jgi:PKD repeat protein
MKKLTIALLGSIAFFSPVLGLRGVAAAQTTVTRFAYEQWWADAGIGDYFCYIGMVVDGRDTIIANGIGPKVSPDGSRIAFTGTKDPNVPFYPNYSDAWEVLVLNLADGSITNLTNHPAYDWGPVWSHDGGKIAFVSRRDGWPELYVMDANGANLTRVTHSVGFTGTFAWSPDGGRFAFTSDRDGAPELYVMDADGSNLTRLTNNVGYADTQSFVWSPDGSRIAFDCVGDAGADICAINSDGTNFVRLTSDPAKDSGAVFSPVDGRIAFVTERFGTSPEIAVMDADGTVTRIAAGIGGANPVWSPDGNRLIFVSTIPSFYTGRCYFDPGAHNADDFCGTVYTMYLVYADGSGLTPIASGDDPEWFTSLPGQPVAAFTYQCSGVTCDFDAAGSFDPDGTIASYSWQFGDGTSGGGPTAHHDYATGNQYGVSLTVTDNSGATGIVRVGVRANTAPIASFTVVCDGPTCTFDGSSSSDPDGTIASYEWFFGDDNWGGTAATANHTYRTGTFSATLIVTDNGGATNTMVKTLSVVNAPPVATFTSTCNGTTCTFDGSASSDPDGSIWYYSWTFGDGTTGNGAIVSHTFAAGATYTVTLVVDDLYGTGSQSQTVTIAGVNAPPVASFTSSCSELECTFNASGSSDPDGTIANYSFNFGDGTTWTGTGWGPYHRYAANGSYTVTLTVTDNGNLTAQTAHLVTVALNLPPGASFTSACGGFTCTFDGSGSSDPDGTIRSYGWNFGDGATGSGATSSRTYAAGGTYTVTLTVIDNVGATTQIAHVITVNSPPVAAFTSTCSGLTCSFNASGSSDPDGTIASYAWTFGDGTTGSGATTSRTYAAGGSYTVALTVTDNGSAASQTTHVVTVNPPNAPPVASFTSACNGLTCSFNASGSSDPDGTIASYAWSFGDGTTNSGATANHTYAAGGSYTVTLTVTDNAAATSTQAQGVTVVPPNMHVGDLDRASTTQQNTWTATVTITIHNGSHDPLANAVVSGTWSDGSTGSCITNATGQCAVSKAGIPKRTGSVNFTVANAALGTFVYKAADNHDPDGDSNGTTISVIKQ